MKKYGLYLKNPVPFGLTIASNPGGKKRRRRRNPSRRNRRASINSGKIVVVKKPTRNPAKRRRRKVAAAPVLAPVKSIPSRRKRRGKIRNPRRRQKTSTPVSVIFPTMKTKRRRSRSRSRNPVRRSRRSSRRRNPARRRSRRMRNPVKIVDQMFNPNMLTLAAGLTIGTLGTQIVLNKLVATPANGAPRAFNLPMVDYSVGGAEFYARNKWTLLFYQVAIPGVAGYFLRDQSPRLANGLMAAATFNAVSGVVKNSGVLDQYGVSRNFGNGRPGTGYLPGTPTQFTGPAQQFLAPRVNNVPQARRGAGAMVGPGSLNQVANATPSAFRGAN